MTMTEGTETGFRVLDHREWRKRMDESFARHQPPDPVVHPAVVLEILNVDAVREMDPLVMNGDVAPCWGLSEATVIVKDKVEILRLTPADPGTTATLDLPLEIYEAIVASAGVDPTDPVASEWGIEGQAAAREILRDLPPTIGMPGFRGQAEARLRAAEAEAAWYGATSAQVAEVTGRAYVPRRSLRATGGKALSLTLARRKGEAEAARAAEAARVALEEERRPNSKTLSELGLDGVAVPIGDPEVQVPPSLALAGISPVWIDPTGVHYFCWRAIEGLPLPSADFAGCRTLRPDEVLPVVPTRRLEDVRDASNDLCGLTVRLRRRVMPDVDRGPISTWSNEGLDAAKEIAAKYADFFYRPRHAMGWVIPHTIELVVRGLRVRPDLAAAIVWGALLDTHARVTGEPRQVPRSLKRTVGAIDAAENLRPRGLDGSGPHGTADLVRDSEWTPPSYPSDQGAVQKETIEKLAVEAAASGEIEPGSLLPSQTSIATPKKRAHNSPSQTA